jgi:hypothetical protein
MLKDYLTILIGDFNIEMFNQQHFKTYCTNTNWNSLLLKAQPLIIHKNTIFGLMHQHNNVIQEECKHIG